MNIRELSPELAQLAKDELGEVPSRIPEDLRAIKEWLSKQRHINARTDDQWLLAFLRGCKSSLERTKERLDNYYTLKTLNAEMAPFSDTKDPKLQEILNLGAIFVLPKPCSPNGPKVIMFLPGKFDPKSTNVEENMRSLTTMTDLLLYEDDHSTVAGLRLLVDYKNFNLEYLKKTTPALAKKIVMTLQDGLPLRLKGFHLLNTPSGLETVTLLLRSFMNKKINQRLFFHSLNDMESLYKFVPKDILPEEYGGNGGKLQDVIESWNAKIEAKRDWFLENSEHKTDESKRPGKPKTAESVFGVEGSFRQLSVD